MKLQDIFDYMENTIGWNLDDFYNVYCIHKDYMFDYCDAVNDTVNDDEQLWCCQFMTDFLRAFESLSEKENDLRLKNKRLDILLCNAIIMLGEQYSVPVLLEQLGMTENEYFKIMGDDFDE